MLEALTGMGRTEQVEILYGGNHGKVSSGLYGRRTDQIKGFSEKIQEQLDHPYDILDNIQENMTERLEKVQEPYQCNWVVFREIYHMVARMIERSGQQVQLMLCTLTDMEEHPIRSDECAEVLSRYIWESICRSIRAGDVVTLREGTVSGASDQYKTGGLSGDPETHRCTVPEEKYRV